MVANAKQPKDQLNRATALCRLTWISQHTHEFRAPARALPTMQNFIYTNVGQALACVSSSLFLSNYTIQSKKKKGRNTGHVLSQECPSPALLTPYREFLRCPGLNQSIHTRFWWEWLDFVVQCVHVHRPVRQANLLVLPVPVQEVTSVNLTVLTELSP